MRSWRPKKGLEISKTKWAHCNYIVGNFADDLCNENPDEEADAAYNWWGCEGRPEAAGWTQSLAR